MPLDRQRSLSQLLLRLHAANLREIVYVDALVTVTELKLVKSEILIVSVGHLVKRRLTRVLGKAESLWWHILAALELEGGRVLLGLVQHRGY